MGVLQGVAQSFDNSVAFAFALSVVHQIVAQSFSWRIPRYPKLKATPPSDNIITNVNALPMGPIGFALNGVPFFNA